MRNNDVRIKSEGRVMVMRGASAEPRKLLANLSEVGMHVAPGGANAGSAQRPSQAESTAGSARAKRAAQRRRILFHSVS